MDTDQAKPWEVVLQVAGALSGFAGLVYLIGATTLWLRASLVGLPADIAVTHEPRASVIALGIRGLILVIVTYFAWTAFFSVCVVLLLWCRNGRRRWLAKRSTAAPPLRGSRRNFLRRLPVALATPVSQEFVPEVRTLAHKLSPHALKIAAAEATVIVLASFASWLVVGVIVSGVATLGGAIRLLDPAHKNKAVGFLGAAVAALAIGVGWQVRSQIDVQGVFVTPSLPGLTGRELPYFGETSSYIYVGVIGSELTRGRHASYNQQIEELRRDKRLLTFAGQPFAYCRSNTPPGTLVWHFIFHDSGHPALTQC